MGTIRIVKEDNLFYPEYYHKSFFGRWLNRWERFYQPTFDMVGVGGEEEISFRTLKEAEDFLDPPLKKAIIKSDGCLHIFKYGYVGDSIIYCTKCDKEIDELFGGDAYKKYELKNGILYEK